MDQPKRRHGRHPQVFETTSITAGYQYTTTEDEHAKFEEAVLRMRDIIDAAASATFNNISFHVEHEPTRAIVFFSGTFDGLRYVYAESRNVHMEHGLGVERVASLVTDLLVKIRRTRIVNQKEQLLRLYWIEDAEDAENWFVGARNASAAKRFYSDHFGDDAHARSQYSVARLVELPRAWQKIDDETFDCWTDYAGWPSHACIKACGGVFRSEADPRTVEFRENLYTEFRRVHPLRRSRDGRTD